MFHESVQVWMPLAVVVIGGAIAWSSALAVRRWDRRIESRASVAGALEECLSATQYFYEDLATWQAAGWGRPETDNNPRAPVLAGNISEMKRQMFGARGRLRAAFARLSALDPKTNLDDLGAIIDDLVNPDLRKLDNGVAGLRERVRVFVQRWRLK